MKDNNEVYLQARKFRIAKCNTPIQACEDAIGWNLKQGRFAVCDGATTSSYSAEWASLLADLFVECPPPDISPAGLQAWLDPIQKKWAQAIPWDKLDYFSKRKARTGAYATLAGMCLDPPTEFPNGRSGWVSEKIKTQISVVEDSCIFLLRNGAIARSWAYTQSSQFQGPPYAIGSLAEKNCQLATYWKTEQVHAQHGDLFIIATDAIAKFLLSRFEQDAQRWQQAREWLNDLLFIPDEKEAENRFDDFVNQRRSSQELRDDDVAIILLSFEKQGL
jgi:hypothetical protein